MSANVLVQVDNATDLSDVDCSAVVQLKRTDPENGNSDGTFAIFRRDAKSSFSILQLAPESKKGTGYLKTGDDMYTYDPGSRQFSYTSMKDSFSGSDAKNSDMEKSTFSEDYRVTGSTTGTLGKFAVWILDLGAVNSGVTYAKQKLWIDMATTTSSRPRSTALRVAVIADQPLPLQRQGRDQAHRHPADLHRRTGGRQADRDDHHRRFGQASCRRGLFQGLS